MMDDPKQTSIADAAFLSEPELQAVFSALGRDPQVVRLVGGAVRNTLMDLPVHDLDLATSLAPNVVVERGEAAGLKVVPTGLAHGTVTLIVNHKPFEVTTLRADVETDGRHAKVAFTTDWVADASRRDFTINALYADADGKVYDYVGGLDDIATRTIRFIGSPDQRIEEDYLRILRFFRFFAFYGTGRPDAEALKACSRHKKMIEILSVERVWSELKRLLSAQDPSRSLLWMRTIGVLERILPESWGIDALGPLIELEQETATAADPMVRLASVLPPDESRLDELAKRLKLSSAESERLVSWAELAEMDWNQPDDGIARLCYEFGAQAVMDAALVSAARRKGAGDDVPVGDLDRVLQVAGAWVRPTFPVQGKDLLDAGFTPGPEVGERLRALETRWIDSNFSLSRAQLLEQV